jgi:uncharacterized membrane protein
MPADLVTLATILGMAAATYALRAGGFLIAQKLKPTRFVEAWLNHLPGAMIVALVLPAIARGGPVYWAGALLVLAAARSGGPLIVSLAAGIGTVLLVRSLT